MTFSVVIAAHNSEDQIEYVLDELHSISKHVKLEVILVDDASSDKTIVTAKRYKNKLDMQIVRNLVNKGAAFSRNLGIEKAKYDLIVINDSDDISNFMRFTAHKESFDNGADISFVSSSKKYGLRTVDFLLSDLERLEISSKQYLRYILTGTLARKQAPVHLPSATMAIRREVFNALGGFDASMRRNEDVDLIYRALELGCRISTSSQIGVLRVASNRPHQSGSSNLSGEMALLNNYGKKILGAYEIAAARYWFKAKAAYFDATYTKAAVWLGLSTLLMPQRTIRSLLGRIPRRLAHDFKNWKQ
jgi:glycosyltransferase involved in cell wall biosynthesis